MPWLNTFIWQKKVIVHVSDNLDASAAGDLAVMFSRLKRLVKPVISDAINTQVRLHHRPAFSEDDHLWDERYSDHISI